MAERTCTGMGSVFKLKRDQNAQVWPVLSVPGAPRVDPLPLEPIPRELRSSGPDLSGEASRRVVEMPDGWLVAMDRGEFGGGLYWVDRANQQVVSLDAARDERIRWIAQVTEGVLGVAGLCHGWGCVRSTSIYHIVRGAHGQWSLVPKHRFAGCPTLRAVLDRDSMLVSGCGALYRVTPGGLETLGTWPKSLLPLGLDGSVAKDKSGDHYVVFRPGLIARFSSATPALWLAPSSCIDPRML
ncbi:hypothetical protein ACFL5O_06145 [Myxococcota bacterium]